MRAIRWTGDKDHYLGPFTFAWSDHWRTLAICVRSGDDEDRLPSFRLSIGRMSFLSVLPQWLIRPEKKRVQAKYWSPEDVARMGQDWYWDLTPREYGIHINDGHLSIHYGRASNDSSTEQQWGCFLPWTQWRHVRLSYYGLAAEHVGSVYDADQPRGMHHFDAQRAMEERVPKASFDFRDYDGKQLSAETYIDEREWRRGTGWFRWLSLIWPKKIRRSLSIKFSDETGPEKGSWKGGTIGTGIDMKPGELHEAAFRRYCDEEHRSKYRKYKVEFIGPTATVSLQQRGSDV